MKTFLSIEVGEQKVRYLLVEQGIKGLGFKGAGESNFTVGPSAPGALASYIKGLVSSQKLRVERLFLTVNRRDTIVHQFNLGQVSKGDLKQIIPSEIEKIPSFADKDFEYVHHQYDIKTRSKVIFGAMTDNLLQYLLKEIKQTGIPCQEMEMAPLNLTGLLGAPEYKDGLQSLIILSDHITHLVIFEKQQIRYLYSTTVGEEILGDPSAIMTWGEELKRALKSYVLETKHIVNKEWLVWDKDKSPDFDGYLQKQLHLDAKPLNLLQEWFKKDINPIYVLAAIPLIYQLKKIKPVFSLTHFLRNSKTSERVRSIALVGALFIIITGIGLGSIILRFNNVERQANTDSRDVQKQMVNLKKQSADIINERNAYQAMRQQLLFQATYVKLLKNMSWSEALSVVASELPKELSLMSFKVDETGVVTFSGEAFRMESIAKLLRTIETSSVLDRGQFSYLTEAVVEKQKVFHFGILANIKTGDHS